MNESSACLMVWYVSRMHAAEWHHDVATGQSSAAILRYDAQIMHMHSGLGALRLCEWLQAPSICAAAKAHTEHLSTILTQHACSASAAPVATSEQPSSSPEVEAAISSLTQRIASLEAELSGTIICKQTKQQNARLLN